MWHSEDPKVECVLLSGICRCCAKRPDAEIAARATPLLCKAVGGRVGYVADDAASLSTQ
jgi:hypothetical protein